MCSISGELFATPVIEAAFELEEEILSMETRNLDSASLPDLSYSETAILADSLIITGNSPIEATPSWELKDLFFEVLQERMLFRTQVLAYLTEPNQNQKNVPKRRPSGGLGGFGSDSIIIVPASDFQIHVSSISSHFKRSYSLASNQAREGVNFQEITNRKLMRYYAIRSDGPPYQRHQVKVSDFFLLSPGERKCNPA